MVVQRKIQLIPEYKAIWFKDAAGLIFLAGLCPFEKSEKCVFRIKWSFLQYFHLWVQRPDME